MSHSSNMAQQPGETRPRNAYNSDQPAVKSRRGKRKRSSDRSRPVTVKPYKLSFSAVLLFVLGGGALYLVYTLVPSISQVTLFLLAIALLFVVQRTQLQKWLAVWQHNVTQKVVSCPNCGHDELRRRRKTRMQRTMGYFVSDEFMRVYCKPCGWNGLSGKHFKVAKSKSTQ